MKDKSFHYGTIIEALNDFRKRGYTIDFNLEENCFVCDGNDKYNSEYFEIVELYRYEGSSDPEDDAIVYAIESKSGLKGILLSSYGASTSPATEKMLHHLNYQK